MGDTKAALAVATQSVTNHYTVHQDATEIAIIVPQSQTKYLCNV